MADREQLYTALRNAHAAGDTAAAQRLATYIQAMPQDSADSVSAPAAAPAASASPSWSDVPLQAVKSLPASAGNFVSGIAQAIRHPIDTAGNVVDMVEGGLRKLTPDNGAGWDSFYNTNPSNPNRQTPIQQQQTRNKQVATADATGQFFKDRYGSADGIKNTLATDPVGVASDLSTVLTGGAGLAKLGARGVTAAATAAGRTAPGVSSALNTAGQALGKAGDIANPVNVAKVAAIKALPKIGDATAAVIGNLGTHTGAESIKSAYQAGQNGGTTAQALADNMRGNVPMTDVLATAKANLQEMGRQKSAVYRQGMAAISGDKTVLDFAPIDQALANASDIGTYKGQIINQKAAQVHQAISDAVDAWKGLDPAEYHTPEGFDALKRQIGGIVDSVPMEEKTAGLVGNNLYNAVKDSIVQQAPVYADTMKSYSDATEQIREIERALSLGKKASVDTAMRKLQSLTRNNVNTNYGNRLDLARQLEQQGGNEIMPALAGQALSSWTPRGLGNVAATGIGLGGYAAGGLGLAVPALAFQSPRLMGEAALAAGKGAAKVKQAAALPRRVLDASPLSGTTAANLLYQIGRLPQR